MTWNVTFADSATFACREPAAEEQFDCTMDPVTHVTENDHTRLLNREEPDQHPMGAITGLDTSLGAKVSAGDALTNLEIETLLGGM